MHHACGAPAGGRAVMIPIFTQRSMICIAYPDACALGRTVSLKPLNN